MNPDLISLQASEFIAEALPVIRKDMGGESPEDPIGVMRTSEMLGPIKGDQLADLAALALRMLARVPAPAESYYDCLCSRGCDCSDCYGNSDECEADHHD